MIKVYDDFLPIEFSNELLNIHTSVNFPWFFQKSTYDPEEVLDTVILDINTIDSPQLTHLFYDINSENKINSSYFNIINKILNYLPNNNVIQLHRIKSNLSLNYRNYKINNYQPVHQDIHISNYQSLLYYVNDSDGETYFFEDDKVIKKVKPKKNTAVLFDSNMKHCGSNPMKTDSRIIINFIFKI